MQTHLVPLLRMLRQTHGYAAPALPGFCGGTCKPSFSLNPLHSFLSHHTQFNQLARDLLITQREMFFGYPHIL
ncbi:MAG: hypothetical protein WCJ07_04125 [Verrucomicrobiota bacterium]